MNVEKAIKILRDTGVGTKLDYRYSAETLNAVKKIAIQALQAQAERRWIAVSERLPEEGQKVVIYNIAELPIHSVTFYGAKHMERGVAFITDSDGMEWFNEVTHWMPLPEPPKEDCND